MIKSVWATYFSLIAVSLCGLRLQLKSRRPSHPPPEVKFWRRGFVDSTRRIVVCERRKLEWAGNTQQDPANALPLVIAQNFPFYV